MDCFAFCPRCGKPRGATAVGTTFGCAHCGFLYYFNPASAAAAFIRNENSETLFIRREKEPARGKLAIPGGFIDFGETAEIAARREIREEVNLEVAGLRYLCSQLNEYPYQGITYSVLDLFFVAEARPDRRVKALDGVASYRWLDAAQVNPGEIAFSSIRAALALYVQG